MKENTSAHNTTPHSFANPERNKGVTGIEIVMGLAIIAIILITTLVATQGNFNEPVKNLASIQAQKIIQGARSFRDNNNSYTGISMTALSSGGYNVDPFTNGTGQNAYNLNVTLASITSGTDARMVYQTTAAEECQQFIQRIQNADGVKASTCSTSTATITIE